jgi:hypothetical protein
MATWQHLHVLGAVMAAMMKKQDAHMALSDFLLR